MKLFENLFANRIPFSVSWFIFGYRNYFVNYFFKFLVKISEEMAEGNHKEIVEKICIRNILKYPNLLSPRVSKGNAMNASRKISEENLKGTTE